MPQLNRRTIPFLFGALTMFAIHATAQTEHSLLQQSQMKSEAELSPEEQRILELNRLESMGQLMANDEASLEEEVRAGKVPRKPLNLSGGLGINENEANVIRLIMHQAVQRLNAIETRRASESLRGMSLQERGDRIRLIQQERLSVWEIARNSLQQQLGSSDFEKFDTMLKRQFPWYPPRIVNSPNTVTANPPSEVRP